jgi:hypothetical protein
VNGLVIASWIGVAAFILAIVVLVMHIRHQRNINHLRDFYADEETNFAKPTSIEEWRRQTQESARKSQARRNG